MLVKPFFESDTSTYSYVIACPETKQCAILDSVLNFDMSAGKLTHEFADTIVDYVKQNNLSVQWILETHIHADHVTASAYLKNVLGGTTAIGSNIVGVLRTWIPILNTTNDTPDNGIQFEQLFNDGDTFQIGNLKVTVMHTPGHTPACLTYIIDDALFVGDTIFMPYAGTARTDFPGGSSSDMYASIQRLYAFPNSTRVFVGHDYPPEGLLPHCESTIGKEKSSNIMIKGDTPVEQYIRDREQKNDASDVPRYLYPSIQINLRSGHIGAPETNNQYYYKVPLSAPQSLVDSR